MEKTEMYKLIMRNDANECGNKISTHCLNAETNPKAFSALVATIEKIPEDERKAAVNECVKGDMAPLFYAVVGKSARSIKLLIKEGADPNPTDQNGCTPLHYTAGEFKDNKMTECLLENGADPNHVANRPGYSPMVFATKYKNFETIKLLFRYGADPRIPTAEGYYALDAAEGNDQFRKLLLRMIQTQEVMKEKLDAVCDRCKMASENLRRCGRCYGRFYCSRECQVEDWKSGHKKKCKGFLIAKANGCKDFESAPVRTLLSKHSSMPRRITTQNFSGSNAKTDFLKRVSHHIGEHFIVKVQIPLSDFDATADLMVYCEDRCCIYYVSASDDANSYKEIVEYIQKIGICGIKGYFWAEIHNCIDLAVKIYHSKMAPRQAW